MVSTWLWLWLAVLFAILLPWVGYGWGYRRWGPPYPSYVQRRQWQGASADGVAARGRYDGWGWHGDAVWGVFLVATFWAITATYWWRW